MASVEDLRSTNGHSNKYQPRILIIGAGSRGNAYARAVSECSLGQVAGVADPIRYKRRLLGSKYIWKSTGQPSSNQEFGDWQSFVSWETKRRTGQLPDDPPSFDGVFICVLDEQHVQVVTALAPFGLHIMCEKPLATTLTDCLRIYSSLLPHGPDSTPETIFGIGHVLRYSPHNMLLRRLVLEDEVIGDVLSVEHTEPVGWWHFSHSYVRGNWRKESHTAPSLLTKSCHDIDWLLWMLCSPARKSRSGQPHLPAYLSSTGSLKIFRKSRKPAEAGAATNCLSCPIEEKCMYSARKIYYEKQLEKGNTDWPVNIVNPEIESCYTTEGSNRAKDMLLKTLSEDYDEHIPGEERSNRPWFGRCVWESDNDVCDDQFVTITWDDDPDSKASNDEESLRGRNAKTATFHMIAGTEKQCERRGWIYGSKGEIEYDGTTIRVHDFATGGSKTYNPPRRGGGHGGGDDGLAQQFLKSIIAVQEGTSARNAQLEHLGCTLEEVIRSHALVFAAEEARKGRKVLEWEPWWANSVEKALAEPATLTT